MFAHLVARWSRVMRSCEFPGDLVALLVTMIKGGELDEAQEGANAEAMRLLAVHAARVLAASARLLARSPDAIRNRQVAALVTYRLSEHKSAGVLSVSASSKGKSSVAERERQRQQQQQQQQEQ
jgi:hypothetical protein